MAGAKKDATPAGGSRPASGLAEGVREKFVTFNLADREMAVDIFQVREIIRLPEQITVLPQAPPIVVGLIQLRGTLVPLVCLRRVFGLPEAEQRDRKVLVTESASGFVGLVVDDVREVREIPASCQERPRGPKQELSDRFIGGIANQNDRVTMLLDLTALDAEIGAVRR
jgi:purine-binding chemotaxis protein CheW